MSHYSDGRRFEYRVRDELRRHGYTVIRSAGSKTPVDLIGIGPNWTPEGDLDPFNLLFIQIKRRTGTLTPTSRLELQRLANTALAVPVVAYQPAPRQPISWRELTGPGAKDWRPWNPGEAK